MKGHIMAGSSVSFYLSYLVRHVPGGDWLDASAKPCLSAFLFMTTAVSWPLVLCLDPSSLWLPWKLLLPSQFFDRWRLLSLSTLFCEGTNLNSFANKYALEVVATACIRLNLVCICNQPHLPLICSLKPASPSTEETWYCAFTSGSSLTPLSREVGRW